MGNPFSVIGIARESKSPENPSESLNQTDLRVALVPDDVRQLITSGRRVIVERGAGEQLGFSSEEYRGAGSEISDARTVYSRSDLVLKLKGPSLTSIEMMRPQTTMGCFAHLATFPERQKTFNRCGVNLLALEEIVYSPERIDLRASFGRGLAAKIIPELTNGPLGEFSAILVGFTEEHFAFAQQASRLGARVRFVNSDFSENDLPERGSEGVIIYDAKQINPTNQAFEALQRSGIVAVNLNDFNITERQDISLEHLEANPPKQIGRRRIEFLTETGVCGTRFGFELLEKTSALQLAAADVNVILFGYGNVARGAIVESLNQGARKIDVLGRNQINRQSVAQYLVEADLIINGIDFGPKETDKFVVSREHVRNGLIRTGGVVIDLVGGCKNERSAIESIVKDTFLDQPYFIEHGVYFSALWGWPMLYMMKESTENYSHQITDLLLGDERLIDGFDHLSPGVERALYRAQHAHHRLDHSSKDSAQPYQAFHENR